MPIKWLSKSREAASEAINSEETETALEGKHEKDVNMREDEPPADPRSARKISVLGAESVDRGQWTGQFDFLMSMIAYAVGLGNVWRFPYLCFKNGGGSFLVVYALFFIFGAVPIFLMEVTVLWKCGKCAQFSKRRVLKQTPSIDDIGGIQWELLGLMFLAWVVVYFALWKGITQARKFVYFCALFPYFLIVVLLIRGLTLPGAMNGISFYLTPNITKLTETTVWKDAGTQVFYSYGVGFGTLIALGSHNKFNHNCYRDAIVMCFINGMTSILAGFAIFSILGFVKCLLATLQVCMMEGLFTALEDTFPTLLRKYKKLSLLVTCIFFFIIGIPMVTYAGAHWLTLVDAYGASGIALLFVVFFEVVGLAWGFGAQRVRNALKEMIGQYPLPCFTLLWKYTAPLSALILFICCVVMHEPLRYPTGVDYPKWAEVFGLCLSACSMVVIPGYAIYYMFCSGHDGGLTPLQRFRKGIHPPREMDFAETSTRRHNQRRHNAHDEELEFIDKRQIK
uniref:Transporter n=1 Tax=Globodera pallida TaxID=36090 RepID=A0A183BR75_GLOPA